MDGIPGHCIMVLGHCIMVLGHCIMVFRLEHRAFHFSFYSCMLWLFVYVSFTNQHTYTHTPSLKLKIKILACIGSALNEYIGNFKQYFLTFGTVAQTFMVPWRFWSEFLSRSTDFKVIASREGKKIPFSKIYPTNPLSKL